MSIFFETIPCLLYGLYYKTWSFKASIIWYWNSTGRLWETFFKKCRCPWFSLSEAFKTWDKPGCLIETFWEMFSPGRLIEQDHRIGGTKRSKNPPQFKSTKNPKAVNRIRIGTKNYRLWEQESHNETRAQHLHQQSPFQTKIILLSSPKLNWKQGYNFANYTELV